MEKKCAKCFISSVLNGCKKNGVSLVCSSNVNIKQCQILDRVDDRAATSRSLYYSGPGRTPSPPPPPPPFSSLILFSFLIGAPQQPHTGARCCLTPRRHPLPFSFSFRQKKNMAFLFRPHPLSFNLFQSSFLNQPWRDMVKLTSRTEREKSLMVSV